MIKQAIKLIIFLEIIPFNCSELVYNGQPKFFMHIWEKTYKDGKFEINTINPSVVVEKNSGFFRAGSRVLDIGCGNGRNAIFSAQRGCIVDCIDVADLRWINSLSLSVAKNINFKKQDIENFSWPINYYDVIIVTRVIQYISYNLLEKLIKNIYDSLTINGVLLLNYNAGGGIHNRKEIKVPKFIHDIVKIELLLKKYFKKVQIAKGSKVTVHVNYVEPIESYEIICLK